MWKVTEAYIKMVHRIELKFPRNSLCTKLFDVLPKTRVADFVSDGKFFAPPHALICHRQASPGFVSAATHGTTTFVFVKAFPIKL